MVKTQEIHHHELLGEILVAAQHRFRSAQAGEQFEDDVTPVAGAEAVGAILVVYCLKMLWH